MAIQITTQASDYVNRIKEYTESGKKKSQWEEYFLTPLQNQTAQNIASIQAQTAYDISGAFANYQKQQRQLLSQNKLGSGFKEEASADLKSAYQSSYATAQSEALSDIAEETEAYTTALTEENERLYELGEKYADVENASLDFLKSTYGLTNQEIWQTDTTGTQTMTDYARSKLVDLAYGEDVISGTTTPKYEAYANYLKEQGLYDTYAQNRADFNKYLFGVDASTSTVGEAEQKAIQEGDLRKSYATYLGQEIPDKNTSTDEYKKLILEKAGNKASTRYDNNLFETITIKDTYKNDNDLFNEAFNHKIGEVFEYKGSYYKRKNIGITEDENKFTKSDAEHYFITHPFSYDDPTFLVKVKE